MLSLLLSTTLLIPTVSAQDFTYKHVINIEPIAQETSVWVPLDLQSQQYSDYAIMDDQGEQIPFKLQQDQVNILEDAELKSYPLPADTVPPQDVRSLIDANPNTSFQPQAGTVHSFRFTFNEPQAPQYLTYQLASGWIDHVQVKIGMPGEALRDSYVGRPAGTQIKLSGERAQLFEIIFKTREGVVKIAEAKLLSPRGKLLLRAQPERTYTLMYGTNGSVLQLDNSTVFEDAQTIVGDLGPAEFIASQGIDSDNDGVPNVIDNCPSRQNTDQADSDGDGLGDVCDNAPRTPNTQQKDSDKDGIGDGEDNCPHRKNPDQKDVDLDGRGWACDDMDGDGIENAVDNCVGLKNRDQQDLDNSGRGDACEDDRDEDGIPRASDNCSTDYNPHQSDRDNDSIGDVCDVCPHHYDPKQIDRDENGIGDVCQNVQEQSRLAKRDTDEDGTPDGEDVCPDVHDPLQRDQDGDGVGDRCDNCPQLQNTNQRDRNNDGRGDVCTDSDEDGILDPYDNCASYANEDQKDKDEDGIGDPCDDDDGDRIENARDNCPYDRNPRQEDEDSDGTGNVCDGIDDRWSEEHPWVIWVAMGTMVVVLTGLGGLILSRTGGKK